MSYNIHSSGLGALVDGVRPDSEGVARAAGHPLYLKYRADVGGCGPAPIEAGAGEPLLARYGYVVRHDSRRLRGMECHKDVQRRKTAPT